MDTLKNINLYRLDKTLKPDTDTVIVEYPLELIVNDEHKFNLLCSPENIQHLVTGFLYSLQMINVIDDIVHMDVSLDRVIVKIQKFDITPEPRSVTLKIKQETMFDMMQELHDRQILFKKTGGAHAAGIFDHRGKMLIFVEDVARHNAFDKAIGMSLAQGISLQDCGAVLSSRVSVEMINKAVRARLQLVEAVSAPSSYAVEVAEKSGTTLCAFVRKNKANIYTHKDRIIV